MARFSVQVSRHYGGYKGVGGQIGMHAFSEHDAMAEAKASARKFARKFPKDEILIYDNQTKRVTTVRAMPKQNPSGGIRAQVRRLSSGEVQIKIPLKRGENPMVKARELAKALGRKVVSVARAGAKSMVHNPSGKRGKTYFVGWSERAGSTSSGETAEAQRKTLAGAERLAARMSEYSMTGREGWAEVMDSNGNRVSSWKGGKRTQGARL